MSQSEVYKILVNLGGQATKQQIIKTAKALYPDITLYKYVPDRLKELQKWRVIEYVYDLKDRSEGYYKIMDTKYLERRPNMEHHHCEELDRILDTLLKYERGKLYYLDPQDDEVYGQAYKYCPYCSRPVIGVKGSNNNNKDGKS